MRHTLDYVTSSPEAGGRRPSKRAVAFVAPPAAASLAWLVARIAIRYGHWEAVPLFLLWLVGCAVACVSLAVWSRPATGGWRVGAAWFFGWIAGSVGCAAVGLALVDLLPIPVGDSP